MHIDFTEPNWGTRYFYRAEPTALQISCPILLYILKNFLDFSLKYEARIRSCSAWNFHTQQKSHTWIIVVGCNYILCMSEFNVQRNFVFMAIAFSLNHGCVTTVLAFATATLKGSVGWYIILVRNTVWKALSRIKNGGGVSMSVDWIFFPIFKKSHNFLKKIRRKKSESMSQSFSESRVLFSFPMFLKMLIKEVGNKFDLCSSQIITIIWFLPLLRVLFIFPSFRRIVFQELRNYVLQISKNSSSFPHFNWSSLLRVVYSVTLRISAAVLISIASTQ